MNYKRKLKKVPDTANANKILGGWMVIEGGYTPVDACRACWYFNDLFTAFVFWATGIHLGRVFFQMKESFRKDK